MLNRRKFLKVFGLASGSVLMPALGIAAEPQKDAPPAFPPPTSSPFNEAAQGMQYCVVDFHDGTVYLQEKANEQRQPASLTKMALLNVLFDNIADKNLSLYEPVKIPLGTRESLPEGLAQMEHLHEGQRYPLYKLMQGAGLRSCAVSTFALAHHYGKIKGTDNDLFARISKTVADMNALAARNNMQQSLFNGVTGDKSESNLSTPYDMALLVSAMQNDHPFLCEKYLGEGWFDLKDLTDNSFHVSRAVRYNPDVKWAKTGHTDPAGFCEALYAVVHDRPVILTIFGVEQKDQKGHVLQQASQNKRYQVINDLLERTAPIIAQRTQNNNSRYSQNRAAPEETLAQQI
ncbi:MAG: hypothetical protein CL570_04920 [Alphaproteobacteria bacterium]|nr:hypothetical protein [Alphaproteobacteria bacterium]|tara:strand:+ start:2406 stop:3443 length:1038 start_codon:yes stop_codon:yes gene_type:complete